MISTRCDNITFLIKGTSDWKLTDVITLVDVSKHVTEVSKEELRRIAIVGTHMHKWQGKGIDGLKKVIKEQAVVQLDPLNPAGREHDIFFAARIRDYKIGQFEEVAYPERLVFESYGYHGHFWGILCAFAIEHFPLFYSRMDREFLGKYVLRQLEGLEKDHPNLLDSVEEYVQNHGETSGDNLKELGKADPSYASWKSGRLGRTALETLWSLGRLAVSRRDKNFRKVYDLVERFIPREFVYNVDIDMEEFAFRDFLLKQKSYPLIYLGNLSQKKSGGKETLFTMRKSKRFDPTIFEHEGDDTPVILKPEGSKLALAAPPHWEKLAALDYDDDMRAIAPLDPLIWDRRITEELFNFEYVWEVYKRANERRWGYYVYPLLYLGQLIARLEVKFNKKTKSLTFFNFQAEEHYPRENRTEDALLRLITRWGRALNASTIRNDESLRKYGCEHEIQF